MPQLLTREQAVDAFQALGVELDGVREASNFQGPVFLESRDRVQAVADRGALIIGSIPLTVDLAAIWRYQDPGMLPEDNGAPIHAFHRRLFHYQGAAKRILGIMRDDILWRLHAPSSPAAPSARVEAPVQNAFDRQYAALLELMPPIVRLVEWSKRYITPRRWRQVIQARAQLSQRTFPHNG